MYQLGQPPPYAMLYCQAMPSPSPDDTTADVGTGPGWVVALGAIGDRPNDSAEDRLRHRFLVFMGALMSCGGLIWGGLSLYSGIYLPAAIPLGYVLLTALNLAYFARSKNFPRVRFIQVLVSLVLPFLFQWTIGGFFASGAVMLWAMLSIVGALTFTDGRTIIKWLVLYSLLAIVSGVIDAEVHARYAHDAGEAVRVGFFVINIVLISNIVFGLTLYFIAQRQRAERALASANEHIEDLEEAVRSAQQLGQYTLESKLGQGGMGEVYRASHAMLRRPTAVKLLPPDKVGEQSVQRFEQEVQLTAQLTHPNTITVFDYGRTPDGIFYYAMELLDGASLRDAVHADGPQVAARVVHILRQTADALAEAHEAGLIHRDIKPANIVVCNYGGKLDHVKVLDFGLVRSVARTDEAGITTEGMITGTPAYLAPEVLTNPDQVDHRSDLYAVGAVGFFLLTGEDVFSGNSVAEVCGHHIHTTPDSPSARIDQPVPTKLERLILSCLEKDPAKRPHSAAELERLLSECEHASAWTRTHAREWWDTVGATLNSDSVSHAGTDRTIEVDLRQRHHDATRDVRRKRQVSPP